RAAKGMLEPVSKRDRLYRGAEIARSRWLALEWQEIVSECRERGDGGWGTRSRSHVGEAAPRKHRGREKTKGVRGRAGWRRASAARLGMAISYAPQPLISYLCHSSGAMGTSHQSRGRAK